MASSPTITHPTDSPTAVAGQPNSPFTAIASHGFLSNCHTGALVAPDGTVDWLCAPRFDSPSVFGSLLDRGAGRFRFAPFGINVPSARIYEPGTNSVVTSWTAPPGWMVVCDAVAIGPRRDKDTVTPHSRPPADAYDVASGRHRGNFPQASHLALVEAAARIIVAEGPGRSGRAARVTLFSPRCSRFRLRSITTNINRFRWMR